MYLCAYEKHHSGQYNMHFCCHSNRGSVGKDEHPRQEEDAEAKHLSCSARENMVISSGEEEGHNTLFLAFSEDKRVSNARDIS